MRFLILFLFSLGFATSAISQMATEGLKSAQILPGWRKAPDTHIAALELDLASGWKTYWRTPGEGGLPPRFDFSASKNVRSVRVIWPTPHAFDTSGLQTLGYKGRVILPLEIKTTTPAAPVELHGALDLGICSTICVPVRLMVTQELSPDQIKRDGKITAALADRPLTAAEATVLNLRCHFNRKDDGVEVKAQFDMAKLPGDELAVIEADSGPVYTIQEGQSRSGLAMQVHAMIFDANGGTVAIDREAIRITVIGHNRAVEINGCASG